MGQGGKKDSDMRHDYFLNSRCDIGGIKRQRHVTLAFLEIDMRHRDPGPQFKKRLCPMSIYFLLMSLGSVSYVEFKERTCHPVHFKGQLLSKGGLVRMAPYLCKSCSSSSRTSARESRVGLGRAGRTPSLPDPAVPTTTPGGGGGGGRGGGGGAAIASLLSDILSWT